jgi:hypothetical protein
MPQLNLYYCDAGEQSEIHYECTESNVGHQEWFKTVKIIAAPTRGAARAFIRLVTRLIRERFDEHYRYFGDDLPF